MNLPTSVEERVKLIQNASEERARNTKIEKT